MIRPIYELKCRTLDENGETIHYHWRIHAFWFWESPLSWVNEEIGMMGERVILDSLRKVR